MITTQWIALTVFIAVYVLIIDERVHRAVAAMAGAAIVIFLGIVSWEGMLEHLDFGTLFLLIGMMVIINTARGSGIFEYIAIRTAKKAKGSPLMVMLLFMLVTAIVSAFLDNVTTVLLLTPMLLYITKVMNLKPIPFLLAEIFASNVGGTATLIGDPPNIMIASASGLSFNEFIINMGPIVVVDMIILIVMMYAIYGKDMKVSKEKQQEYIKTINSLDEDAAIVDRKLFNKSIVMILMVVFLFFIHSNIGEILHVFLPFVDPSMELEPAEVALFGAAIFLLWSRVEPEEVLEKVEWLTIFFFAGLFIVVGALVETGLIEQLATWIVSVVHTEGEAVILISWFAAFASAFVDNIPLTATMIPLIQDMGAVMDTYPLWWALSLGACLGGNGTAIGASANVVVLGIADRQGISISFVEFLKMGLTVMIVTVAAGLGVLWMMQIM